MPWHSNNTSTYTLLLTNAIHEGAIRFEPIITMFSSKLAIVSQLTLPELKELFYVSMYYYIIGCMVMVIDIAVVVTPRFKLLET